jgi:hypothetical protein
MAHKKAGGSTKNGRDSQSKRLGVKHFGGEAVTAHTDLRPRMEARAALAHDDVARRDRLAAEVLDAEAL